MKSAAQSALVHCAPPAIAPVTPPATMDDILHSSQTMKLHREKISTSFDNIFPSPISNVSQSSTELTSISDMVPEAVRTLHGLSKYQKGLSKEVQGAILQTIRRDRTGDHMGTVSVPYRKKWSSGSMWMRILEMGSSENQKVTIYNMLGYMGAWEWYDTQVTLSKDTARTRKNKPLGSKGAATRVLIRCRI